MVHEIFFTQDPIVCHGAIQTYSDLFAYVLPMYGPDHVNDLFCGIFHDEDCLSMVQRSQSIFNIFLLTLIIGHNHRP